MIGNINEFKEKMGLKNLPAELEELINFENNLPNAKYYSNGFETIFMEDKSGLVYGWCDKKDFLDKLIPFATANGSGSFYTLWINDVEKSLSQMPVIVFGDEGGVHIIAENILELLHLITYDVEIEVDENRFFFPKHNTNYKESENLRYYLQWINEKYNLESIKEPEIIIKKAQEKYGECFRNWFKEYYK
ncbi:MAG: SMI1/KNR4 family protein [Prevotellaceae bacterium]|jgi:hypothetical protein|nr:SMI1/KNR4 family protein [Prevotellaceae bacterium]